MKFEEVQFGEVFKVIIVEYSAQMIRIEGGMFNALNLATNVACCINDQEQVEIVGSLEVMDHTKKRNFLAICPKCAEYWRLYLTDMEYWNKIKCQDDGIIYLICPHCERKE